MERYVIMDKRYNFNGMTSRLEVLTSIKDSAKLSVKSLRLRIANANDLLLIRHVNSLNARFAAGCAAA